MPDHSSARDTTDSPESVPAGKISPDWARALVDEREFKQEQVALGRCWTVLGIAHDLKKDGDWFRSTLGGRSVFVQRFGDTIKGFENRCAHRFFPLRTSDKGNGRIVCGFHHWQYNNDGLAVGIPNCLELFGTKPRELGAKLVPVEVATCGSLIFGRFAGNTASASLEEYLGEGFPILEAMCTMPERPHRLDEQVASNWKLLIHAALDDYHLVPIHHHKKYRKNSEYSYFRFGAHSANFFGHDDTLTSMATECREKRHRPASYRMFNIFPNLVISLFGASPSNRASLAPYWYCHIQQYVPVSPGHTQQKGWFFQTQFRAEESAFDRLMHPFSDLIRAPIVRLYLKKIGLEDHRVCEQLQSIAHQIDGPPILGSQEKRVKWFEEAYSAAILSAD